MRIRVQWLSIELRVIDVRWSLIYNRIPSKKIRY